MPVRKWGTEQLVNTNTNGIQFEADVAALPDGGFVVVWSQLDASSPAGDGSGASIKMQRYDAAGNKVGVETQVNTTTSNDQNEPTVAVLSDGSFVVAWSDDSLANGTGSDIRFRHFAADGIPIGADIAVATGNSHVEDEAKVVALASGKFAIAFNDSGIVTTDNLLVRFNSNDTPIDVTPLVIANTGDAEEAPGLAVLGNGSMVGVWFDSATGHIRMQRLDANGAAIGGPANVTNQADPDHSTPQVVALTSGGYVVAWEDDSDDFPDTSQRAIHAQIFDSGGVEVGSEFVVNSDVLGIQDEVQLVPLRGGGFAAVWNSLGDMRGQIFDNVGAKIGTEFQANSAAPSNQKPAITVLADGRLIVAYTSFGPVGPDAHDAIVMQILDPRDGVVTGNDSDNLLYGHDLLNDEINGLDGNDTLIGMAGGDNMYGGRGNDSYVVDSAGDRIFEISAQGTDAVFSSISIALPDNVENLILSGAAGTTGIGNPLANVLVGNSGANLLNGRAGNDFLVGNAGKDSFFFNAALNAATNVDTIASFSVPQDTIRLENAVFHGLAAGKLAAAAFCKGAHAHDANDRIIYNAATGALFYDSNGNHAGGAIKFAQLAAHLALTNADFFVV